MLLNRVQCVNFRNYKQVSLDGFSSINFFSGDNGEGKTSFLEAIHVALRGRSFKPYVSDHLIRKGEEKASVFLKIEEDEGSSEIEILLNGSKKNLQYCGKKVSPYFLSKKFPLFVFTEQSLKAIRQGPQERRDFIDQILVGRGEKEALVSFLRILKEKNQLLKSFKKDEISGGDFEKTLEVLNQQFLQKAFVLTQARLTLLKEILKNIHKVSSKFFENPVELGVKYQIHGRDILKEETCLSVLKEDMKNKQEIEKQVASCLSGPHKHEIIFLYNNQDSRSYCSQGQQRTLLLALLGTQLKEAQNTFLFLDDVLMELDEKTTEKTLDFLGEIPCQTFLTNCKKIPLTRRNTSFFRVKNGTINLDE